MTQTISLTFDDQKGLSPVGDMLIAIVGCWTESNIAYDLQHSPTADWIFVKTAEKFEVWCEDILVSDL